MVNYLNEDSILWKLQIQDEIENLSKDELDYNINESKKEIQEMEEKIYKIDSSIWSNKNAISKLDIYGIIDVSDEHP